MSESPITPSNDMHADRFNNRDMSLSHAAARALHDAQQAAISRETEIRVDPAEIARLARTYGAELEAMRTEVAA